jgi:outer membrane lipoprotein-sorting protein
MTKTLVIALGILAPVFALSASAQDADAEKIYRDLEKRILAAKAHQVETSYAFGKQKAKTEMVITQDNKFRMKITGQLQEKPKSSFELVSDGEDLKSTGASLSVMPSGLPSIQAGGKSEWPTPMNFHETVSVINVRAGAWYSVFGMPYLATGGFGEKLDADGRGSKIQAYNFKLLADEKIGDQDAKVITYRFGDGSAGRDNADIKLWIGAKSQLPLKRTFVMESQSISVTETYLQFKLDPKLDAKHFDFAK